MKSKIWFFGFFLVLFIGCSKKEIPELPNKEEKKSFQMSHKLVLDALDVQAIKGNIKKWAMIHGKVYDVFEAKSGKVINLNFGPNYKSCFKAVIFQSAFEKWPDGKAYFKNLVGKQIAIEGAIDEYSGMPQIVINSPTQIRIE